MRSARPGRLRLGDRVRFQECTYTVVGLTGMRVRLADVHGTGMLVDQVLLQAAEDFAVLGAGERAALGSAALLGHLPKEVAERALWWQGHLVELLTGLPPDAPAGTRHRPEYDPATRSLAERERAKAAELAALGEEISARTVKRKRQRYEASGVEAVVDHRLAPHTSLLGQADPRVAAAIRQVIAESVEASTRTIEYARWRTEQILAAEHGKDVVEMPSRATFHRLFGKLSRGVHVTDSARTRRSLADQPEGPFRYEQVAAPGEAPNGAASGDCDQPSVLQGLSADLVRAVRPDVVGTPLPHPVEHSLLPVVRAWCMWSSRGFPGVLPRGQCPLPSREFRAGRRGENRPTSVNVLGHLP